jgi:hypothetical protein
VDIKKITDGELATNLTDGIDIIAILDKEC